MIVTSSPAVANGCVSVGSFDNNVYCLNATTGAKIWSYATGGWVSSSPAISSNGYVYINSDDNNTYCLNAQTGALVWSYSTFGLGSPAIADSCVYVGSNDAAIAFGLQYTMTNQPTTPILTLQSSDSKVNPGGQITLSGTISPSTSGTVSIYESVNGSAFTQIASPVLTDGAYSYQCTLSELGTYVFQTSFQGNVQYNATQSTLVSVSSATAGGTNYTLYITIIVIIIAIIIIAAYYSMSRRKSK
jgi:outer membrane protein assembly factor BamB